MKNFLFKILTTALAVCLITCLFACGTQNNSNNDSNSAHVHDWQEATCYTPKTCKICKKTEGLALDHSFGEWYVTKEASCKEEGELYKDCLRCDFFDTRMIPVTDHQYKNWVILDEPSCTVDGLQVGYCSCGLSKTEIIPKGHNFVDGECEFCGIPDTDVQN